MSFSCRGGRIFGADVAASAGSHCGVAGIHATGHVKRHISAALDDRGRVVRQAAPLCSLLHRPAPRLTSSPNNESLHDILQASTPSAARRRTRFGFGGDAAPQRVHDVDHITRGPLGRGRLARARRRARLFLPDDVEEPLLNRVAGKVRTPAALALGDQLQDEVDQGGIRVDVFEVAENVAWRARFLAVPERPKFDPLAARLEQDGALAAVENEAGSAASPALHRPSPARIGRGNFLRGRAVPKARRHSD